MKKMKRILAVLLALVMCVGMGTVALAAGEDGEQQPQTSIKIENTVKGTEYKVYKIFDATKGNDSVAYKVIDDKHITEALKALGWEESASGYITKAPGTLNEANVNALIDYLGLTWNADAKEYTGSVDPVATGTAEGSTLTININDYGYFLVVSNKGAVVSIDDVNDREVTIIDKNETKPTVQKTVNDEDVYIRQELTYTLEFTTTNYSTETAANGATPKEITEYTVTDILPAGLDWDGTIESITIDGEPYKVDGEKPRFSRETEDSNEFTLTIPWAATKIEDEKTVFDQFKYNNGAKLKITYKATVNENISLGNTDKSANENTVSLTWKDIDGGEHGGGSEYESKVVIATYAIVIQKIDDAGNKLAGAEFTIDGYIVNRVEDGLYKINGEKSGTSDSMACDSEGKLVIYGLANMTDGDNPSEKDYVIKESVVPDGYNKIEDSAMPKAHAAITDTVATITITKLDENGAMIEEGSSTEVKSYGSSVDNVVVVENKKGAELPSTGGIGTTIFYVVGGLLVIVAGILLITKKRMSREE